MLLSAFFFFFRHLLVVFFYLLSHLVFSLLDQGGFEPLFEFKEADILLLLFLKPLFFVLLQFHQLFVLDVHFLAAVPFEHLVRPLLHSYGLFFLLLDESFEEISFGFKDQLALQFGFMVLAANPFSVGDFDRASLKFEDFSGMWSLTSEGWRLEAWFTTKTAFGLSMRTSRDTIVALLLNMISN